MAQDIRKMKRVLAEQWTELQIIEKGIFLYILFIHVTRKHILKLIHVSNAIKFLLCLKFKLCLYINENIQYTVIFFFAQHISITYVHRRTCFQVKINKFKTKKKLRKPAAGWKRYINVKLFHWWENVCDER